jgi:hypothetical protein
VDPSQNGSREGVVVDEILRHNRIIPMGNEILERRMEFSSRTTKGQETNKGQATGKGETPSISRLITNKEYPNKKYKRSNRVDGSTTKKKPIPNPMT